MGQKVCYRKRVDELDNLEEWVSLAKEHATVMQHHAERLSAMVKVTVNDLKDLRAERDALVAENERLLRAK